MLAIIIPYFKLTFFEETLQSLSNQTNKDFNVYIGDDASPDNPENLILKYKEKFNFEYKRFESNLGGTSLVKQWERCIALSGTEEWIMILGDDDVLGEKCVEDFYKNLPQIINYDCNVVRYATVVHDVVHQKTSLLCTHPTLEKATDFFYRRMTNQTRSSLSEYIFKRSAFEVFGFYQYQIAWHTDDRAWLEFTEFKYIYTINASHVTFRLSAHNISRSNYKLKEKQQATFQFYDFIIFKSLYKFKRYQRKFLMLNYEQLIYKQHKVTLFFWFYVSLFFLRNCYFLQSIKFTRRLLIHLNKNA
jgi:glycosyltransferase involved in cell wall biosynthesis